MARRQLRDEIQLTMIGYWHDIVPLDPPLPHPQPLVDSAWEPERRSAIVRYLQSGTVFLTSFGHSYCRLCCVIEGEGDDARLCEAPHFKSPPLRRGASGEWIVPLLPRFNGITSLCDGVWGWPEGLAHYVEAHGLRLPDEFVAHAAANGFQHEPASRALSIRCSGAFWREWSQANAPFTFEPNCLACVSPFPEVKRKRKARCRAKQ